MAMELVLNVRHGPGISAWHLPNHAESSCLKRLIGLACGALAAADLDRALSAVHMTLNLVSI